MLLIIAMMAALSVGCALLAYAFSDARRTRRLNEAALRAHYARTSQ